MVTDYRAFHCTVIGASHKKKNTVCQDYSESREKAGCRLLVVCDGHGGADYFRSDRGSRFAAETFLACTENPDLIAALSAAATEKQQESRVTQLIKSIVARWNTLVDRDLREFPFTEEELCRVSEKARRKYETGERMQAAYGTTLIGTVLTEDFWLGIQIGDGSCVAVSHDGIFSQPVPWDEKCFLNVTTSLCDTEAAAEFRYTFGRELPAAVIIGSDGIGDCFAGEEKLYDFYRLILKSFAETEDTALAQLAEYLPILSEKGSGDDMSVGILLHPDYIRQNRSIFEKEAAP